MLAACPWAQPNKQAKQTKQKNNEIQRKEPRAGQRRARKGMRGEETRRRARGEAQQTGLLNNGSDIQQFSKLALRKPRERNTDGKRQSWADPEHLCWDAYWWWFRLQVSGGEPTVSLGEDEASKSERVREMARARVCERDAVCVWLLWCASF